MLSLLLMITGIISRQDAHPVREPLTTISALQSITSVQASYGLAVHIQGQITYVDTGFEMMFIHDRTGSAFVKVDPKTRGLAQGELVILDGVTTPGAGGAFIIKPKIRIIGKRPLPAPRKFDLAALDRGGGDSDYVTTEGILRPGKPSWQHTSLLLVDDNVSVPIFVPGGVNADILRFTGARVRVTGVSGDRTDGANRREGANLWVQKINNIEIQNRGFQDMMDARLMLAADLQRSFPSQQARSVQAVHLRGRVLWHVGEEFVIEDASEAITVRTPLEMRIDTGDLVDVVGFPEREKGLVSVVDARVRISETGLPQPPTRAALKWSLADALHLGRDGDVIRMAGRVVSESRDKKRFSFRLEDRVGTFEVLVGAVEDQSSIFTVAPGSMLEATGTLRLLPGINSNRSKSVLLLVNSPSDIVVRNSRSFNWRLFVTACAAAVLLAAVLWVVQMRRALRIKTALLRAQMQQEAQLENRYRRLFERNLAAVFRWRPSGEITECNEAFARMLGFDSPEKLVGMSYWSLLSDNPGRMQTAALEATSGRESRLCRVDGSTVYLLENITAVNDGGEQHYETVALDVTELKRAQDAAQRDADVDALTGLPNRRRFSRLVRRQMQAGAQKQKALGLLYMDLDGFKAVNDTLGHVTGDWLLQQVALRLGALLSAGDHLCRIGGDEFAVLLTRPESVVEPRSVAQALLHCLQVPFRLNGQDLLVGASIGISSFPDLASGYEALMQQADSAMYLAKRTGRNRLVMFSPEIGAALHERSQIVAELKGAVGRGEVYVVYQPEFSVRGQRLLRFEALARWRNSKLGDVPPAKFVPVAEESGLIGELGSYVLEMACKDAIAWQRKTGQLIAVAVNVSAIQLRSEGFVELVVDTLQRTGLSPGYLELEMTESIMLDGLESCQRILARLRAAGVRLALDDFGTGYSSLSYLPELPFERLKIDRSFLARADCGRGGEALIASIVSVAHTLEMSVVAEGIETPKDLQFISRLGADELQGYLLGRPEANPCLVIERHFGRGRISNSLSEKASEEKVPCPQLDPARI
jgi:diguanylate cyclase (GGDEF)-like protein/PAS domain S-box-containing protein